MIPENLSLRTNQKKQTKNQVNKTYIDGINSKDLVADELLECLSTSAT